MSEYKMADLFELPVYGLVQITTTGNAFSINGVEINYKHQAAITQAINNHDRLTAQVEELNGVINENLIPRLDAEFEATDDGIIYMIREEINELLTRIGEDNE